MSLSPQSPLVLPSRSGLSSPFVAGSDKDLFVKIKPAGGPGNVAIGEGYHTIPARSSRRANELLRSCTIARPEIDPRAATEPAQIACTYLCGDPVSAVIWGFWSDPRM